MIDRLKQIGFERIAIADDADENINVARQLEDRLPGIQFEFYQRGDLLVAQLPERYQELGLILTDRQMETDDAGLDVVETAWKYHVPTFVCSGGYQHGGKPRLRIAPTVKGLTLADGMLKDNPDTWYQILEGIVNDATGENGSLLQSVLRARKAGVAVPAEFSGEQARRVAQGYLDMQQ
jgi:CheY-like chemotaxis protein